MCNVNILHRFQLSRQSQRGVCFTMPVTLPEATHPHPRVFLFQERSKESRSFKLSEILWMDKILDHPRHHGKPLFVGIYRGSYHSRVS